jgi:signal transduction histidine kinase
VDNLGDGFYSLTSVHFDIDDELYPIGSNGKKEEYKGFENLKNIHFKAYYFIYNVGLVPKQVESAIRQNAEEYGGIRLYRNGFRVLPYAEKDNDWIGLDASMRKNVMLFPHGNNNFYGFIEVYDKKGEVFQELSSREGLLENKAFNELKDFAFKVLIDATRRISSIRGTKAKTGQRDWEKKPKEVIEEIASSFEEEAKRQEENTENNNSREGNNEDTKSSFTSEDYKEFAKKLRESAEQEEEEKRRLLQEVQLLRILASLGLTIGEFVHEIKHHLRAFDLDLDFLHRTLTEDSHLRRTTRLQSNLNSFTTYTSYFDKAISENVNRELAPVEIKDAIHSFYKVIQPDAQRSGIILLDADLIGYNLYTCPMHNSEWASILFNFYTNSKKAIKRAQSNGVIKVKAGEENGKIYLEFSDNGDGIPQDKHEKVFEVFYTTSAPSGNSASESEATEGTGLGLKIVKDIVSGYGGEIFVSTPEKEFTTTIRIEIPKTEIEYKDE